MTAEPLDSRPWAAYIGAVEDVITCSGEHHRDDRHLCVGCERDLKALLLDLPALALELDLAITRQTAFISHGARKGSESDEEPEPLEWDERASKALLRLAEALDVAFILPRAQAVALAAWEARGRIAEALLDPDVADWARELSEAAWRAWSVVDRPPDLVYLGPCPKCRADIDGERGAEHVTCPRCDYAAPMAEHQLAALTAGEDRMLTVSELVGAITQAGETVTRDQINSWIRREGLPREVQNRASWRKGRLTHHEVYVYRLGDVREMALRAERKAEGA